VSAAAGLIVAVAVAVGVVVATRGGSAGPEDTVGSYLSAAREGDCEAMVDMVSASKWEVGPRTRDEVLADCRDQIGGDDSWRSSRLVDVRLAESDLPPEAAQVSPIGVEAVVELDGEEVRTLFIVVDEEGWKIQFCSSFPSQPCA
jgi:hypothetical protein